MTFDKEMTKHVARFLLIFSCLSVAIGVASCSRKSKIGTIQCKASRVFSFSAKISSSNYPSRGVSFEPNSHDGYSEAIYEATVSSVLTNAGTESFMITATWADIEAKLVAPGESLMLPPKSFKDYGIRVIPSSGKNALIDFRFTLDRAVTTDSTWALIASWADGP